MGAHHHESLFAGSDGSLSSSIYNSMEPDLSSSIAACSHPDHDQNPRCDNHEQNYHRRLKSFDSGKGLSWKAFQLDKFSQVLNHEQLLHQFILPQLPQFFDRKKKKKNFLN